ncbi:MAG: hypothetical protein K1X74_01610 [Pirellulales bacterium]|nr:hypothetical protein [Pirellulales bacterium]
MAGGQPDLRFVIRALLFVAALAFLGFASASVTLASAMLLLREAALLVAVAVAVAARGLWRSFAAAYFLANWAINISDFYGFTNLLGPAICRAFRHPVVEAATWDYEATVWDQDPSYCIIKIFDASASIVGSLAAGWLAAEIHRQRTAGREAASS